MLLAALAFEVVHRKQTDSLMELQKERYRSTVASIVLYLHVLDDDE